MEENKFRRPEDAEESTDNTEGGQGSSEGSGMAPQENIETPAAAAREMAAQEEKLPEDTTQKSSMLPVIAGILAIIILGALAYFFLGGGGNLLGGANDDAATTQNGASAADVSFSLDETVARVNGEALLGSDLAYQMVQAAQQAGVQDLSTLDEQTMAQLRQQSLNAIVNTELLVQAAREEGLSVSEEEVEQEYQSIVENVGGQEVAEERFDALGITEEEFRANLADDLIILDYIDTRGEAAALEVSEEEIQAFYDRIASGQEGEMPPLADVRGQIEEQLQFQKQQEVLSSIIDELRAAANIELLLGNGNSEQ